ncbi:hypothetical protein [Hyalangium sp.]|uniref:hypothetical protein n=1 Tax=Hyalangium sp. TaxID=2028555 RepID=UPI002D5DC849|nr:hypothetical protein [Hyalangium sp.]HYI00952.1 hypothetical protein [Hyalangium sp.]
MRSWHKALAWSAVLALLGVVLVRLFPDSYQQDGGQHYVFARWAFDYPWFFVKAWARPLFELVYAPPAQLGYSVAKLVTVALCLATGWHTFRLAEELGLARAHLVIPLLWFQPSWLLLCHELMTEPLFALVFILALRLHLSGRVNAGMWVASLLILARPEGFFLGILWGVWILLDRRNPRPLWRRLPSTLRLAAGFALWWLASVLLTGNPLFILHDWPKDWNATNSAYGTEPIWSYVFRLPEIVGPLLALPLVVGLGVLLLRRRLVEATSAFLTLFLLHSVFRTFGLFGDAGYPRYLVCVSPAMALITLAGWNALAEWLPRRRLVSALGALVLGASALAALLYVDAAEWSRDAWAIDATLARFREAPRPVHRFHASQRYMYAALDYDPKQAPPLTGDREHNVRLLREAPPGTLIFWEDQLGHAWHHLTAADIEALGYTLLRSDSYVLPGKLLTRSPGPFFDYGYGPWMWYGWKWPGFGGPRTVRLSLLYKER